MSKHAIGHEPFGASWKSPTRFRRPKGSGHVGENVAEQREGHTMNRCPYCGQRLDRAYQRPIRVASNSELRDPIYLGNLKVAMVRLRVSRRRWRDVLADTFRDFDGRLTVPGGRHYELPEVDAHFPEGADTRWIDDFIRSPYTRLQARTMERVRLIDLHFRILHPALAATFAEAAANDNDMDQHIQRNE